MVAVRGADGRSRAAAGRRPGRDAAGPLRRAGRRGAPARPSGAPRRFATATRATSRRSAAARAVADIHGLRLSGLLAWMTWLVVHLWYLVGFQNRVVVFVRWSFSFLTRGRSARLITGEAGAARRR